MWGRLAGIGECEVKEVSFLLLIKVQSREVLRFCTPEVVEGAWAWELELRSCLSGLDYPAAKV